MGDARTWPATLKSAANAEGRSQNSARALRELIFIKLTLCCIITFPNLRSLHINIYNVIRIKSYLCDFIHLLITLFCFKDKSWLWGFFIVVLEGFSAFTFRTFWRHSTRSWDAFHGGSGSRPSSSPPGLGGAVQRTHSAAPHRRPGHRAPRPLACATPFTPFGGARRSRGKG